MTSAVLNEGTIHRLERQLDVLPALLAGARPEQIDARTAAGKWSARENLAHLARHHALFLERIERILEEDAPRLGRYVAEEDPAWPEWSGLSLQEILARLRSLRAEIVGRLRGLPREAFTRSGIHPLLGEMPLSRWVEFFLLHEAHHLYTVMLRIGDVGRPGQGR